MATTQIVVTELSTSDKDPSLCGQPGCLGHERVQDADGNGKVYVPGFISQTDLEACQNEIVVFDHRFKPHVIEAVLRHLTSS
jgi:hypothetical protein